MNDRGARRVVNGNDGRRSGGLERACREQGLRMTEQRRVIVSVLEAADDHPDAVELHHRAVAVDPHISLATVYRTVKLLQDRGILARHAFADGRARYEAAPRSHHDHLIDIESGRVIEFHSPEIERIQEEVARSLGFRIVSHRLEIYATPVKAGRKRGGG